MCELTAHLGGVYYYILLLSMLQEILQLKKDMQTAERIAKQAEVSCHLSFIIDR